jgi:tetratricopeptide (TPR) repeat protein
METIRKILLTTGFTLLVVCVMAQSPKAIQDAFSRSYVSEKDGNYYKAITDLKVVYNNNDYIVNIRLGWLYYLAKQYTESIRYYEKSISLKPYAIEAHFGCVKPLSAIESWEKVKAQYIQILKIDPQNTVANYWLGVIYYNRHDYLSATKLFEKVVNLYPLDYDSVIMLAWTKLRLGQSTDATVLFNQALIIRPYDASALAGLKLIK